MKEPLASANLAPDLGAVLVILLTEKGLALVTGPEPHKTDYRFPGGRIEKTDPSPKHAALREGGQETGIEGLKMEDFRSVHSWIRHDGLFSGPEGHKVHLFVAVHKAELRVWPSETGEKLKFFDPKTILENPLLFERHKQILLDPEVVWRLRKALSHK